MIRAPAPRPVTSRETSQREAYSQSRALNPVRINSLHCVAALGLDHVPNQLGIVSEPEFPKYAAAVGADRVGTQRKFLADLLDFHARRQKRRDVAFAVGE